MIKMNVDKMFSIGSNIWPGLSKITEEAGEVLQVIGKLVGTGGEIMHWDGSNLLERLIEEIGDVLAACEFVIAVNNIDMNLIEARRKQKLALFFQWHNEIQSKEKSIYRSGDLIRWKHHGSGEGLICKIKTVSGDKFTLENDPYTDFQYDVSDIRHATLKEICTIKENK